MPFKAKRNKHGKPWENKRLSNRPWRRHDALEQCFQSKVKGYARESLSIDEMVRQRDGRVSDREYIQSKSAHPAVC